jgi:hypothetical protein
VRRLIAVLTISVALVAFAALPALAGGPDNVVTATATATADGAPTTVERSGLQVAESGGDEVTSQNIAQAISQDCTGCKAVAVALQAVIVTGEPRTVAPVNFGGAVNSNCTSCASFAFAYQYVVSADSADFTPSSRRAIAQLRRQAADLATSGLPFPELDARLQQVAADLKQTVDAAIERSGSQPHDRRERERMDATPTAPQ